MTHGTETVEKAVENLHRIGDAVKEIDNGVAEINSATGDQAETVQTIAAGADDISEMSQRLESTATGVADSITNQRDDFVQIESLIDQFDSDARELVGELDTFQLGTHQPVAATDGGWF